jgi:hypothetical protein
MDHYSTALPVYPWTTTELPVPLDHCCTTLDYRYYVLLASTSTVLLHGTALSLEGLQTYSYRLTVTVPVTVTLLLLQLQLQLLLLRH